MVDLLAERGYAASGYPPQRQSSVRMHDEAGDWTKARPQCVTGARGSFRTKETSFAPELAKRMRSPWSRLARSEQVAASQPSSSTDALTWCGR